ncbi:peptide deformylase [Chitinivorax tropicus]|uniref:Peptide deformylase n=1 Tax=Chitinivorax tropicus TaxID=714531 RepID=A0A840MJY4_9PROT|nr:peptide deformylase [Chitinivorax tropicus]MBB5016876.1 peptide deformylase [Chitinivorax tropicus]
MPIKPVLKMGEPLLWQMAAAIETFDTPALHALIQDMEDTMLAMNGAGIAAPQIGVSEQVVIFGSKAPKENPRYPDAGHVPYTVLCNPQIEPIGDEMEEGWEGCLSVPGLRGVVPRHMTIRYRGMDQFGRPIDRTVSGFHARVVQHECDHLWGVLYPMRIQDMQRFGFVDVLFPDMPVEDD